MNVNSEFVPTKVVPCKKIDLPFLIVQAKWLTPFTKFLVCIGEAANAFDGDLSMKVEAFLEALTETMI